MVTVELALRAESRKILNRNKSNTTQQEHNILRDSTHLIYVYRALETSTIKERKDNICTRLTPRVKSSNPKSRVPFYTYVYNTPTSSFSWFTSHIQKNLFSVLLLLHFLSSTIISRRTSQK